MEWISVNDRLPNKDGYLIVLSKNNNISFCVEHDDSGYDNGDGFFKRDHCLDPRVKDVKFWMYQDECEIYLKFLLK